MRSGLAMIAAADDKWGIGRDGGIPWHLPEDMARFRARTIGKTLIIGRVTKQTLPNGLSGRVLVTVSGSGAGDFCSVEAALAGIASSTDIMIAGGGGIYREGLRFCSSAEITRMDGDYGCTSSMPNLAAEGWCLMGVELTGRLVVEHWQNPVISL